ncbi:hypothetical protein MKEN_01114800 [Mycena kentingensis (nom. inval.)]|nr:hypothetical protein MKEN_01114800 [Mycena kentingensis (nom. inval.)]
MDIHGYSEDEESPILRQFVNDEIAREEMTPSPRSELLSPTEANRSQRDVDRVRHSQRGPSERFRRQKERAYADVPAQQLLAALIEREYECKRLRKGLVRAFERVEKEAGRTEEAERVTQQTLDKFREVSRAKVDAERALAKAAEELRLWKFQFEHAQKEIARAQEVVQLVESQRDDAEKAAAQTRTLARQLKEQKLVDDAVEAGRKLGYKAGFRRAQQEMALRQGLELEGDEEFSDDDEVVVLPPVRRYPDVDGVSLLDPRAPGPVPMPVPQVAPSAPPENVHSPSIQLSMFPIEIPSASVLNGAPNQSQRPPLHVDTQRQQQPPPTQRRPVPPVVVSPVEPLFIHRRVSAAPPSRPVSMQHTPEPEVAPRQSAPAPPPPDRLRFVPPPREPSPIPPPPPLPETQPPRHYSPQPHQQRAMSPSRPPPPDNYIPSVSPDGEIPLPPPFLLSNPILGGSGSEPPGAARPPSWYANNNAGDRASLYQAQRRPRSNAGSARSAGVVHGRHVSLDSAAAQIAASTRAAPRVVVSEGAAALEAIREDASASGRSAATATATARRSVSGQEGLQRRNEVPSQYGQQRRSEVPSQHGQQRRSEVPSQYGHPHRHSRAASMGMSRESLAGPPPPPEKDRMYDYRRAMADELRYSNPDLVASMRGVAMSATSGAGSRRDGPPRNVRMPAQLTRPAPLSPPENVVPLQASAGGTPGAHLRGRALSASSFGGSQAQGQPRYQNGPAEVVSRQSLRRVKEKRPISPSEIGSPMSGFGGAIVQPPSTSSRVPSAQQQITEHYLTPNNASRPIPLPVPVPAKEPPLGFVPQTVTIPAQVTVPVSAPTTFKGKAISAPLEASVPAPAPVHMQTPGPSRPRSISNGGGEPFPMLMRPSASATSLVSMQSNGSRYAQFDAKAYVDPAYYAADTGYDFGPPRPSSRGRPRSRAGSWADMRPRSRANSGASAGSGLEYFGPPGPG